MTTTKRAAVAKKNGKAKEQPQIELCPGSGQTVFGEGPFEPMRCNECGVLVLMEERATRKAKVWAYADHEPPKPKAPPVPDRAAVSSLAPDEEQPRTNFNLGPILYTLTEDQGIEAFAACTREQLREAAKKAPLFKPRDGAAITDALKVVPVTPATSSIVDGEQRYWSAVLCGIFDVPAVSVEPPKGKKVLYQLRCNSATPLRPLEIAGALKRIKDEHPDWTDEELAREAGISSPRKLRLYLALAKLCPEVRTDFAAGVITERRAASLATIENAAEQLEVHQRTREMTDAAARPHVEMAHRKLVFGECHFDPGDVRLLPMACSSCPKNTATQRSMWSDLDGKDGRCTDRACYLAKQDQAWELRKAAAEKLGLGVIWGDAAKALFSTAYSRLEGPDWYDIDGKCEFDPTPDENDGPRTWREVLGAEARPNAICRNPHTRKVHELLTREGASAALDRAGLAEQADVMEEEGRREADEEEEGGNPLITEQLGDRKDRERVLELYERAAAACMEKLVDQAEVKPFDSALRCLISMRVANLSQQGGTSSMLQVIERRGWTIANNEAEAVAETVRDHVKGMSHESELLGLLLELELLDGHWHPKLLEPPKEADAASIAFRWAGADYNAEVEKARADRDVKPANDSVEPSKKCSVCGCTETNGIEDVCERHSDEIGFCLEWDNDTLCTECAADCDRYVKQLQKAGEKGIPLGRLVTAAPEEVRDHLQACLAKLEQDGKARHEEIVKGRAKHTTWFAVSSC